MNLFFTLLFTVELGFNAFSHWYAPGEYSGALVKPCGQTLVEGLVEVRYGRASSPRPTGAVGQNLVELLVKVPAKNSRRIATNRKSWLDSTGCTKIKR